MPQWDAESHRAAIWWVMSSVQYCMSVHVNLQLYWPVLLSMMYMYVHILIMFCFQYIHGLWYTDWTPPAHCYLAMCDCCQQILAQWRLWKVHYCVLIMDSWPQYGSECRWLHGFLPAMASMHSKAPLKILPLVFQLVIVQACIFNLTAYRHV